MMILLFALTGALVLILLAHSFFVRFKFFALKKKIKNNPLIGKNDFGNKYYYKEGGYAVGYKIGGASTGIKTVDWLFLKRRLTFLEEKILNIRRFINNFFLYQRWTVIFQPSVILLLIGSMIIFYFGFVETQNTRVERLKWVVALAAGVNPSQIQYVGNGWLEVSGQRKTRVDRISEPIRYTFNPFRWFFSREEGFVTRWRGENFGYVTHPVAFNEKGDVWINKEGTWRHGRFTNDRTVEWDTPQGTRKVTDQEISTPDKKLYIRDE